MLGYSRPALPDLVFHDAAGEVIPYGSRWEHQDWDGPEETYSVTAHPERFAPFVTVAEAIVEHLAAAYDVHREDSSEQGGRTRVRLAPRDPNAAPLELTFDLSPMVEVTAGATTSIAWFCTCDHCDEDLEVVIENLEQEIAAVVGGDLREWLNDPEQGYVGDDLFLASSLLDGSGSSSVSGTERAELRARFAHVPPRWAPWSLR